MQGMLLSGVAPNYSLIVKEHRGFMGDHTLLRAIDYLRSRCAGLLIATQKLISGEKTKEEKEQRGGVPLVKTTPRGKMSEREAKIT